MPEILHRCVQEVMGKGHDESSAYAICRTSLGLMSDGSEDDKECDVTDEQMRARVETSLQFQNGPSLVKKMLIARPIGEFTNGDQKGNMTRKRLARLVENFRQHPRQVPVFMLGDHPESNDQEPPVGWVEGLSQDGDGNLIASVKLHGPGAAAVGSDLIRGASIYTVQGKDYDGKPLGEVLKHLLLTNEPFIKDMNIAATSRSQGGETVECHFTALPREADMAEKKEVKDPTPGKTAEVDPTVEEPTVAALKERDEEILSLRAKVLQLEEARDDLKAQIDNRPADVEKEELALRVKRLEMKTEAQEIRELVFSGLQRGTLKPSWCKDYNTGKGKDKDTATMKWFAASKFQGDMKLLAWAVENNPPMYSVGKTFASGAPSGEGEAKALTDEQKKLVKSLGHNPEDVEAVMQSKDTEDYKSHLSEKENK